MATKKNKEEIPISKYAKSYIYYLVLFLIIGSVLSSLVLYQKSFISDETYVNQPQKFFIDEIKVKSGDNLYKILSPYQISQEEILALIKAVTPKFDLKKIKAGQMLWLRYSENLQGEKVPMSIMVPINLRKKMKIDIEDGKYKVSDIEIEFERKILEISALVKGSFIKAALEAGAPTKNLMEMINIYSNKIDFQKDIRKGDRISMLIEQFTSEDGYTSFFGKTLYSSLVLNGVDHKLYFFKTKTGIESFFDDQGKSAKTSIMKKPVVAKRISSPFGIRIHPILRTKKMHTGCDFAAQVGTPIYAGGDGKIIFIGRHGGYGKYIKIRHNAGLHTAYAHMKGFAKGLKVNSSVKQGQVIGYVGTSGMSSGPHLHYEVLINNKFVDPLKIKFIPTKQLSGEDKEKFTKYKNTIDTFLGEEKKLTSSLESYNF